MQFLVVLRRVTEGFKPEQIEALLEPEANAARGLYTEGFTRQIWSRGPDAPGAVLVVEAADVAEVERRLPELPMFKAGMLATDLITQLKPYRGFAPR
jgi:muconolactone delta-isomerase